MKRFLFFLVLQAAMCLCLPSSQRLHASDDVADYLLLVDVSGNGRNIYIEGIQQSIDSFYVEATRHGRLIALNFAKTVTAVDDSLGADYYSYCDLGRMLRTLLSILRQIESRHARVFIVSDFHNASPRTGNAGLDAASMSDVSRGFDELCATLDLKAYLMVIPPSTRYDGYSLDAVQDVVGADRCQVVPASPGIETTRFMTSCVRETNSLLGIVDGPQPKGSVPATLAVLLLMVLAVTGLCLYDKYRCHMKPH
ncbi:MAG: hypothetical protein IJ528_11285 [Bacteroidaceae bacterium]|nr:hypothetical protein [Bacteroidaceae bacterium]